MDVATVIPHIFARHPQLPDVEVRTAQGSAACYWTHTHEEYSVGIIDAGAAVYAYGPDQARIAAGTTVLVSPGLAHSCNPESGQVWSYRMVFLQAPWVMRSLGLDTALAPPPFKRPLLQSATVYRRLDRICKGIALVSNPLALEEELVGVLGSFISPARKASAGTNAPSPALQRAKDILCDRLEELVTLEDLAQQCGMDAFQLIRKFKAAFGQSPHAFQLDQRINVSKRLLKQGHSLAEVAFRLGFADQAHFQRHFKKRHAISPSAYLRG